jgi:hypothetical protein
MALVERIRKYFKIWKHVMDVRRLENKCNRLMERKQCRVYQMFFKMLTKNKNRSIEQKQALNSNKTRQVFQHWLKKVIYT